MTDSVVDAGRCPLCGADLHLASVLIEYERDGEKRRFVECPECHGHVTTNVKETVCEDCGLVIEEQRLDHGPEWRAYDADERERTGASLTSACHD